MQSPQRTTERKHLHLFVKVHVTWTYWFAQTTGAVRRQHRNRQPKYEPRATSKNKLKNSKTIFKKLCNFFQLGLSNRNVKK